MSQDDKDGCGKAPIVVVAVHNILGMEKNYHIVLNFARPKGSLLSTRPVTTNRWGLST